MKKIILLILLLIPACYFKAFSFQKMNKCLNPEDFKQVIAYIKANEKNLIYDSERERKIVSYNQWDISVKDWGSQMDIQFADKKGWTIFTVWMRKGKVYLATLSKVYQPEKEKKYHRIWCDFITYIRGKSGKQSDG